MRAAGPRFVDRDQRRRRGPPGAPRAPGGCGALRGADRRQRIRDGRAGGGVHEMPWTSCAWSIDCGGPGRGGSCFRSMRRHPIPCSGRSRPRPRTSPRRTRDGTVGADAPGRGGRPRLPRFRARSALPEPGRLPRAAVRAGTRLRVSALVSSAPVEPPAEPITGLLELVRGGDEAASERLPSARRRAAPHRAPRASPTERGRDDEHDRGRARSLRAPAPRSRASGGIPAPTCWARPRWRCGGCWSTVRASGTRKSAAAARSRSRRRDGDRGRPGRRRDTLPPSTLALPSWRRWIPAWPAWSSCGSSAG